MYPSFIVLRTRSPNCIIHSFFSDSSHIRLTIIIGVPTNISLTPPGIHLAISSALHRTPSIGRRVADTVNLFPACGNGFSGAPLKQAPQLSRVLTTRVHKSEI